MGLIVNVYRATGRDCTLNGISSTHDRLTLVNVDGPFEPNDDAPAAVLMIGSLLGTLVIYPATRIQNVVLTRSGEQADAWGHVMDTMMGGNYAATSDSRFTEACERLLGQRFYGAVAIHDRIEG
jgi:hypothetical protein